MSLSIQMTQCHPLGTSCDPVDSFVQSISKRKERLRGYDACSNNFILTQGSDRMPRQGTLEPEFLLTPKTESHGLCHRGQGWSGRLSSKDTIRGYHNSDQVAIKLPNASIHELFATGHASAWSRYASTQLQNPGSFGLPSLRLLIYSASPAFKPNFDLWRLPVRLLVTPDTCSSQRNIPASPSAISNVYTAPCAGNLP